MIKHCKYCHKEFIGDKRKNFCSPEHRIRYHIEENSKAEKKFVGSIGICEICGAEFKITNFRQKKRKYCENCAKKVRDNHIGNQEIDSDALGRANWREFKRNMKRPKLSIGEISVLAAKAGMSYGQYVAKAGI